VYFETRLSDGQCRKCRRPLLIGTKQEITKKVTQFFTQESIKRGIVKPSAGGSSIGVFSVTSIDEAVTAVQTLFSKRMDTRVVLEPFAQGREFTVIILQNRYDMPVAILPTEIEVAYDENQFFDFRKKYLPTRHVTYHCPPRFENDIIEKIQIQAEQLFHLFGMRDFARFDGFLMDDGNIWFSDFNPMSGMEQNSFLFQQSARIGFSHQDFFRYVINNALRRRAIGEQIHNIFTRDTSIERKPVAVLFGGDTAERQVSLMSGTNVWLKLRGSHLYQPTPYLLGPDKTIWELPYSYILNHTVEEIVENATHAERDHARLAFLLQKVQMRLSLLPGDATEAFFLPRKHTLDGLIKKYPCIFLALHGGIGENGMIQKKLEKAHVTFNGSGSTASALCMDKWTTNEQIQNAHIDGITTAKHTLLLAKDLHTYTNIHDTQQYFEILQDTLGTKTIIAKPRGDGCSAGVIRLYDSTDLQKYITMITNHATTAPAFTFTNQETAIDMPEGTVTDIVFESFIETDKLKVSKGTIIHNRKSGYVEMTVGVVENDHGQLQALSPSITVAEKTILSLEEKFQGGTGVNITPPPTSIISAKNLDRVKKHIESVARVVGIRGYARIDIFAHIHTGDIIVIEVNTLPGLTPSTVIYHQALAEKNPIPPKTFLEMIIKNKGY
jgi:D-alanine-D-alanine ligase-like ATP-grasp enzyme